MKVRLKHERLAAELARKHLSLRGWARRLDLKSGHISQLANGKRKFPDPETRRKLQDGLSLEFDDLFEVIAE
jgi:transcriptional regulator with XRE-family HTH domain